MSNGQIYEIICKRGLRKDTCRFRQQDPDLVCALCSFAGFVERKKKEKQDEQQQSDIQQQDRPTS